MNKINKTEENFRKKLKNFGQKVPCGKRFGQKAPRGPWALAITLT